MCQRVRGVLLRTAIFVVLLSTSSASAAELRDMLGRWMWEKFKIEVSECQSKRICAKVIAGPKNVGMEIFASDLTQKDGAWFGQILNPDTGGVYYTRMQYTGTKTWKLDGCASSRVCLSGEFVKSN